MIDVRPGIVRRHEHRRLRRGRRRASARTTRCAARIRSTCPSPRWSTSGRTRRRRRDDRLLRLLALTCSPSYYKAAAPARDRDRFPDTRFREALPARAHRGRTRRVRLHATQLPDALTPEVDGPDGEPPAPATGRWDADAEPAGARRRRQGLGGHHRGAQAARLRRRCCSASTSSTPSTGASRSAVSSSVRVTRAASTAGSSRPTPQGAYNGHVPVTAINSVIGLIVADANGLGPVVLSNERSSNVGNVSWLGRDVNHQWSKSIWPTRRCCETRWRATGSTPIATSRCCARCRNPRSPTGSRTVRSTSATSSAATGRSRSIRPSRRDPGAGTARSACSSSC